jgi:uncharacterized protein (TIGR02147 family)
MKNFHLILRQELEKRQKNNSAYSLRAFAQFLAISPAALSQMMSGKRGISVKRLELIIEKLALPASELKGLLKNKVEKKQTVLSDDQFKMIADWQHYAILSLGELRQNKADPRWIAKRLNIPLGLANESLQRLSRMGLIEIKEGRFKQVKSSLTTLHDIPSSAIRNFHKNILGLAQNKIESVEVNEREYSSTTMAINSKNLNKAKKLVREFRDELLEILGTGPLDEVYQFSMQLFPLSLKDKK